VLDLADEWGYPWRVDQQQRTTCRVQPCSPTTHAFGVDDAPIDRRGRTVLCALAFLLALASSACTTTSGQPEATAVRGPTVAFESIDGPPESVFNRLVQQISDEADARQVAVVSRTEAAQYRVRSYVATQTRGKRSTIAWVWDVYDSEHNRALRITGEEPASFAGTGTWAAADDQVLRQVARNGMDRLIAFLAAPSEGPRPAAPAPSVAPGPRIAAGDDAAPGTAQIARTSAALAAGSGAAAVGGLAYLDAGR
jgi:hypothetical protein